MTCKTCPTRIRCFLGLRNCPPATGGTSSAASCSTDDGRLDVSRVADALKERNFDPNPNLVSMRYTPEKDRVVSTLLGAMLKQRHAEPFGVRLYGGARSGGKASNTYTPPRPPTRPVPRTEVVRETVVHTRSDDNIVNDVATIMVMDSLLHSHQPTQDVYIAPAPVYEAEARLAPAPTYEPAPVYYSPPPAPSPSYYEPPAPSPSSYDSSSYSSSSDYGSSSSYDSGSSWSSSD